VNYCSHRHFRFLKPRTESSELRAWPGQDSKGKGKVHPRTGYESSKGEYSYSSTLSLTSAVEGVDGQRHTPAASPLGKTRYTLYRRLGGPQGRSGQGRKISPPTGFDPRIVQPIASRYTDWAIPAHRSQDSTDSESAGLSLLGFQ